MDFDLIIFDADGTVWDRESGELLPGVAGALEMLARARHAPALAIVTNQGGPACAEQPWAKPGQFPTLAEVESRYGALAARLGARLYMSLAYVTSRGAVLRPAGVGEDDPRGSLDWRKPAPGMLLAAMQAAGAAPDRTLMIGDRPEDREAAAAAGCYFQWAQKWFGRGWEPGHDYDLRTGPDLEAYHQLGSVAGGQEEP